MKKRSTTPAPRIQPGDLQAIIENAKHELQQMMDLNPQVMLLVNETGTILRTNRALLDFLKLGSYAQALDLPLEALFDCEDKAFVGELLAESGGADGCAVVKLGDGRTRTLLFNVIAAGVNADLRMVIVDDVTDEQAASVHLEKTHKKQAVEELMGALMHNINQPLTVIMVTARLMHLALEKGECDEEQMKASLQEISDQTMNVSRLLDQVQGARDFVTETYLDGMDIMDIRKSAGVEPDRVKTDR